MASKRCGGLFRIVFCGLVLAAVGCGRGPAPPKLAPVSGVVTYKGVPVRDAYVKFIKDGSPLVAGGFTDDTGRFKLTSNVEGDGASVGENKVTITLVPRSAEDDSYQTKWKEAEAIADPIERRTKLTELHGAA